MVDEDRRALRVAKASEPLFDDRILAGIGAGGSPAQHDDPRDPGAGLRGRGAVGEDRSGEHCQPLPPRNHRKLPPKHSLTTRADPLFAPSPQMPANAGAHRPERATRAPVRLSGLFGFGVDAQAARLDGNPIIPRPAGSDEGPRMRTSAPWPGSFASSPLRGLARPPGARTTTTSASRNGSPRPGTHRLGGQDRRPTSGDTS